jgi:hypothetical protein
MQAGVESGEALQSPDFSDSGRVLGYELLWQQFRAWLTMVPAAMQIMITSSVVSMTLCCSKRSNSRAEDDNQVSQVAPICDALIHYRLRMRPTTRPRIAAP